MLFLKLGFAGHNLFVALVPADRILVPVEEPPCSSAVTPGKADPLKVMSINSEQDADWSRGGLSLHAYRVVVSPNYQKN